MVKDRFGNELKAGDKIVFIAKETSCRFDLMVAEVGNVTDSYIIFKNKVNQIMKCRPRFCYKVGGIVNE